LGSYPLKGVSEVPEVPEVDMAKKMAKKI